MNSSPSGSDANAGGMVFATTRWSVVLAAQGQSTAAQAALETLCRTYWMPLYAFIRREGCPVEEAKDLTQEFFARWLERRDFETARREKGRLRSYLLVSLKHFLANERNKTRTAKRGHGRQPISLDEILEQQRFALEPAETLTADQIYERQWATTVLDRVLALIEEDYRSTGRGALFDQLKGLLTDEPGHPSQAEIGEKLGMNVNAVKQAFHRLRLQFRETLREEIAHTVATPGRGGRRAATSDRRSADITLARISCINHGDDERSRRPEKPQRFCLRQMRGENLYRYSPTLLPGLPARVRSYSNGMSQRHRTSQSWRSLVITNSWRKSVAAVKASSIAPARKV